MKPAGLRDVLFVLRFVWGSPAFMQAALCISVSSANCDRNKQEGQAVRNAVWMGLASVWGIRNYRTPENVRSAVSAFLFGRPFLYQ